MKWDSETKTMNGKWERGLNSLMIITGLSKINLILGT
jgi:hypothetical protein